MAEQDLAGGNAAKASRKRNPEESRRRILDAAEDAFSRRGYDGARLRDIAQDAGVHHALVHHYYGDKRGLFEAVLDRGLRRMMDLNIHSFEVRDGLEVGVSRIVGSLFDFLADNRELLCIVEGAFRDQGSVSFDVAKKALGAIAQPLVADVILTLRRGQEIGTVRQDIPAEDVLSYCFSLVVYPFILGNGLMTALGIPKFGAGSERPNRAHLIALITRALRPT